MASWWKCQKCGGDGKFYAGYDLGYIDCPACNGSGRRFGAGTFLVLLIIAGLAWLTV